MPDISMCWGNDCPLKEECYRYLAKPCMLQSYFAEPPYKDGKCDHFWKHRGKDDEKDDETL